MKKSIFAFFVCGLWVCNMSINALPPAGFIFTNGTQFRIVNTDGTSSSFYFSGTNNYYLMYKPMDMVNDVLNDMVYLNQKVVRMWFFMDGSSTHDGYVLQSAAGQYNEPTMKHIDQVMYELSRRGLKAIPVFVNYWSDFGGMSQYAQWANTTEANFYSNTTCKQLYKNYVSNWLNRVNTVTGITYKNDPTVFAWQLTNEARCTEANKTDFVNWVDEMSTYIKSIDSLHMVSLGDEGFFAYTYDEIREIAAQREKQELFAITNDWPYAGINGDWISILQLPNIAYGTLHNYATDNWSYTQQWGENWIKYHIEIADKYNKPCVMEEYDKGYSGNWTTAIDHERATVIKAYQQIIRDCNMAGDMSWMLVGRNYSDPVEKGYTMDNTVSVDSIWLYRVKWSDGHQYSRYDPEVGTTMRTHAIAMMAKNGSAVDNLAPVPIGGSDMAVFDDNADGVESVSFDGSDSFDADGTIVSYQWSEDSNVLATTAKATFSLPIGTHHICFTVTDNKGLSGTNRFTVKVLSSDPLLLEAENALLTGNNTILTGASSSDNKYVQMAGNPATITFTISNVPVDATYEVTFTTRSYNGTSANGSKTEDIQSNEGTTTQMVFPGADTWRNDMIKVALSAGENTLSISANWGYIEIDCISIKGLGNIVSEEKSAVAITSWNIYPNPATDRIFFSENKPVHYHIYNLMGQQMQQGWGCSAEIAHLTTGVYLISINGKMTGHFIKK